MTRRNRMWYTFRVWVVEIGAVGETPSKREYFEDAYALTEAAALRIVKGAISMMVFGGREVPDWCTSFELLSVSETREEAA